MYSGNRVCYGNEWWGNEGNEDICSYVVGIKCNGGI